MLISITDMESLPSLQNLHQALTSEDAAEAEEELLSIISHLLVCAIEDPGIPNPVRHTTLLGQSLRTADITNSNISEILRIYLYAVATGEVRTLNGVTLDRERERRVADHHQLDSENIPTTGKNQAYYEHLQQNQTWKLSECLKDKPFVALNPTVKAEILAHLCNDLLLNKAVIKQIENSLESVAQQKRERYAIENRVRKYKHMHARKVRLEQFEKQQLIAKQLQQQHQQQLAAAVAAAASIATTTTTAAINAVTASLTTTTTTASSTATTTTTASPAAVSDTDVTPTAPSTATANAIDNNESSDKNDTTNRSNLTNASSIDNLADASMNEQTPGQLNKVVDYSSDNENTAKSTTEESKPPAKADEQSAADAAPALNNGTSTPDIMHKKSISREVAPDGSTTDGNMDEELSDIESDGTILEEDEDNRLTSDEIYKKLEKILKSAHQNRMLLEQSSNSLRATSYGQDRYWRRYWYLPKAGGIFVEGLESAQQEILKYHAKLEENDKQKQATLEMQSSSESKKRSKKHKLSFTDEREQSSENEIGDKSESEKGDDIDDNNDELVNQSAASDDSDSTQKTQDENVAQQEEDGDEAKAETMEVDENDDDDGDEDDEDNDDGNGLVSLNIRLALIDSFHFRPYTEQ